MKKWYRSVSGSQVAAGLLAAGVALLQPAAQAAGGSWAVDADGNWSLDSNWIPVAVPGSAAGDLVALTNNLTADRIITLDGVSRTVGTLLIGDPIASTFSYTLAASGGAGLTFNNGGGGAGLMQTNTTASTDTLSAPLTLADNLIVSNRATLTLSGGISGAGKAVTKVGPGTLVLSGANAYSGGTMVTGGGTLQLGAADALPAAGALTLGHTNDAGTAGNLFLGTFSQTLPSLVAGSTNALATNVVTIGQGQTLALNGSGGLLIGATAVTNGLGVTSCRMSGGGALVVTNPSAYVTVGKAQPSQNGYSVSPATLDLSGLSSVTLGSSAVPVNEIRVCYSIQNTGTLTLSNTNNLLTASTLNIGHTSDSNGGVGAVLLGAGTNVLSINAINIGLSKSIGSALRFASQTAGSPGTVTIGGRTRPTTDFLIGGKTGSGTGSTPTGTLDLRGHVATVTAGAVTLGKEDGSQTSGAVGTLLFDSGTFSATNLNLAAKSAQSTGKALATLTVGGGVFTVASNGLFTLASQTGKGSASATNNILGGVLRSFVDIRTGPSNSLGVINLDGGTLDMTGRSIGLSGQTVTVFNARSGTLMNVGEFNAGAPLVKSGSGLLTLSGSNTYSGATVITGGTLALGETGLLGGGSYAADITNNAALVISAGADQVLSGVLSGSGTLAQSGSGSLILAASNTCSGATSVTAGRLVGLSGGALANSAVSVASGAKLGVRILAGDGQWGCKSLTLNGTTAVEFRYQGAAPSAVAAPLQVAGNLVNNGTLNVTVACSGGVSVAVGTYPLIRYTGSLTAGTLGAVTLPNGGAGTLVDNGPAKTIDLSVTDAGSPLVWNGGTGDWDIAATANWSGPRKYFEGDAVVFNDSSSGSAPYAVTLAVDVNPGSITVDNPTKNYTLSGPGALGGDAALTKRSAGTLSLSGTNTYSGGTTLDSDAGTVIATVNAFQSGIGSGPVAIGSGSTLTLDNSNTSAATLSQANTVTGTGVLRLSFATNTAARRTVLTGLAGFNGTVQLAGVSSTGDKWDAGSLAAPGASVQVLSGSTLLISGATAGFGSLALQGAGNSEGRGALRMGAGASSLTGPITLLGSATLASDAAGATLSGAITGTAGAGATNLLTQGTSASAAGCVLSGPISDGGAGGKVALAQTKGTLVLSGTNTYGGGTTVNNGSALQLGADGGLPASGALVLGGTNGVGSLSLGSFSQTLASLTASSSSASVNTVAVAPGQTLVIGGAGGVFVGVDVGGSSTTAVKISGGGALAVTNAAANVTVGKGQSDESGTGTGTLDLSELSSVTLGSASAPINEIRVSYGQMSSGTLTLSNTNNLLTAAALQVGNSQALNAGAGTLVLGAGDNTVAADTVNIGVYKAGGTVRFASQAAGSPGTVTIGGRTRPIAELVIGSKFAMQSSATPAGLLDLRGHVATVAAGTVMIGREDNTGGTPYTGGAAGSLYFDSGTFTATNLVMGYKSGVNTGAQAKASAALTVSGGVFTVTGGPVILATQKGQGSANATLNLLGGTFLAYADMLTGPSNCTGVITLDGGTLNMTGHVIGQGAQTVTVFNARSGTLMNLASLNNGAPLVKTGSGTLSLDGTNTYAGATLVSNGVLRLTGGACLPPKADLYVSSGATCQLDFAGTLPIRSLTIDGVEKRGVLYGQDNLPAYFSGEGHLQLPFTGTLMWFQ